MEIKHLALSGYDDMVRSIYITNRHYDDALELTITRGEYLRKLSPEKRASIPNGETDYEKYRHMIETAIKISCGSLYNKTDDKGAITPNQIQLCHTTIGRFLDISCVIDGLHRGATDDFDAHAMRLNSRIVRRSTRTTSPDDIVLSNWYLGKVIPFGDLIESGEVNIPETITKNGANYVRSRFGYVREDLQKNYDVLRGLTPLGMSNLFTFKCNVTEWAHITKLREPGTHASPELQQMIKMINDGIEAMEPLLNHDFWMYCIQ